MKYLTALIFAFFSVAAVADPAVFAQLSSSENQSDGPVSFDQIDGLQGMSYDFGTGLTADQAGAYLIVSAPQTGDKKGCLANWITVNDAQVDNSNILLCQPANQPLVGVSQGVVCLAEGDVVNTVVDGDIVAFEREGQPLVPSLIFTALRIGDC